MEKRAMAVREEQWLQTIAAAKQSGQPIKVWCAEHGVPVSSFYKWQRKMRDSLLTAQNSEIQFQELEVPQNICGTATSDRILLEHLTKPKSDQSGSKGEKSQMDISSAFISDEQAPVSMEPGKGSLNNPAVLSKMRGTVHPTSGNAVLYMSHGARLSAKRKIVPFISVKFLRMTSGSPVQISQGGQMIQHIFQHFAIIHIGGSEADNKRNSIAIRYEMMFASRTTSIYGVGSCVFAPFFAWMTEPSIQALLQLIFFVSCKFCRMT